MILGRLVAAAVALAWLAATAQAGAATVSLQDDVLRYDAGAGEANSVMVSPSVGLPGHLRVVGSPEPVVGPGCERRTWEDPPASPYQTVECRLTAAPRDTRVSITLGAGDDSAEVYAPLGGVVTGGPGVDLLSGVGSRSTGRGSVLRLLGGRGGDYVNGGYSGRVVARGGPGEDKMSGSGRLDGGPGSDEFSSYDEKAVMVLGSGQDRVVSELEERDGDLVLARDGDFDVIDCGGTLDRLKLDAFDWSPDCEARQISRSAAPRALPLAFSADPRLRQGPGLFVTVGCPVDAPRPCRGTLGARVHSVAASSRRFRLPEGDARVLRIGRTPYCAARNARAYLTVSTGAERLRAARSLAATRNDPPPPVDRLRLPDGKRVLVTLEGAPPDYEISMAVLRRYSGCKLDPEFGTKGVLALRWRETVIPPPPKPSYSPGWGGFLRLVRLPGGRIVLGGTHLNYSHHFECCSTGLGLAGITPEGRVDEGFGDGGFAAAPFPELGPSAMVRATAFYAEHSGDGHTTLVLEGLFSNPFFFQTTPPRSSWPVLARFSEDGRLIETHVTSDGQPVPQAPP